MIALLAVFRLIPETDRLVEIAARLGLTALGALVLQQIASLLVNRAEVWMARAAHDPDAVQRARTLGQMFRNLAGAVVWLGAFLHALEILGWDVKPFLAGAGIVGVALGFGAQNLMRDWIAGFFILVENQYGVGDLVDVNGQPATVEDVTLRATRLRDFNGYVYYVPNGELKVVVNRSRGWNRLAVDVPVAADEDLERALGVCRQVVAGMNAEPGWRERLLEPIEVWGVESLTASEVPLRLVLRAKPGPDAFQAARELRRRCHNALQESGVRTRTARGIVIRPLPGPGAGPALEFADEAPNPQESP